MNDKGVINIDIAKVLKQKAPNTRVPKFIVNYLRKIVHEKEFNIFFKNNPTLRNLDFIEAGLKYLNVTISIEGQENLPPKEGRYIFASNHPLGGLDGIATPIRGDTAQASARRRAGHAHRGHRARARDAGRRLRTGTPYRYQ